MSSIDLNISSDIDCDKLISYIDLLRLDFLILGNYIKVFIYSDDQKFMIIDYINNNKDSIERCHDE